LARVLALTRGDDPAAHTAEDRATAHRFLVLLRAALYELSRRAPCSHRRVCGVEPRIELGPVPIPIARPAA
jgi:hypothetical protein